jgi:undecaprenyl-diphosphatase
LVVTGIKQSLAKFRETWAEIPQATWKAWLKTMMMGWVVGGVLAFLLASLAKRWEAAGVFDIDPVWLQQVIDISPMTVASAIYLGVIADSIFLAVVVGAAALLAVWLGRPIRAFMLLATLFMSNLIVLAGWTTWNRARPDLVVDGVIAPNLHSFPSGHVFQAVVVYGFLAYLWIQATDNFAEKIVACILALLAVGVVIFSRLTMGVHWPTDVIAAVIISVVWLVFLILAARQAPNY